MLRLYHNSLGDAGAAALAAAHFPALQRLLLGENGISNEGKAGASPGPLAFSFNLGLNPSRMDLRDQPLLIILFSEGRG